MWANRLHLSSLLDPDLENIKHKKGGRVLVFCPPHLLDSWRNEVAAVFPDADYRVLSSISDVDAVAKTSRDRFLVAVVSRETAKLGHRLEGVEGFCPGCGESIEASADDLAKKRALCGGYAVLPVDDLAQVTREAALWLRPYGDIGQYLPRKLQPRAISARQHRMGATSAEESPAYGKPPREIFSRAIDDLIESAKNSYSDTPAKKALVWTVVAAGADPEMVLDVAARLKPESSDYSHFAESFCSFSRQVAGSGRRSSSWGLSRSQRTTVESEALLTSGSRHATL